MAFTTINKSTDYFNTKLYTGTSSGNQAVTGVGFQPDWIWTKNRVDAFGSNLYDAIRGTGYYLQSNNTSASQSAVASLISFDSDGFTVGTGDNVQYTSNNGVAWNWKAGTTSGITTNGATVTTPSSYSFNQTAGFSILQYTGTGVTNNKLAHGLGVKPDFIIFKKTSGDINWGIYHQSLTADYRLLFTTGAKSDDDSFMQDSEPDSVNINLGYGGLNNASGATYIAYCFADVQGYSKFGSYTGNGSTDGAFIYTGFKPALVIFKKTSGTGGWNMFDTKRDPFNVQDQILRANANNAEASDSGYSDNDFLSNGFKLRQTWGEMNGSGATYIYMAFAEAPLVGTNNVPANAR